MKNEKLEEYMWRNGITKTRLAEVLKVDPSRVTGYMEVEMSEAQQDEFIEKLKEAK